VFGKIRSGKYKSVCVKKTLDLKNTYQFLDLEKIRFEKYISIFSFHKRIFISHCRFWNL